MADYVFDKTLEDLANKLMDLDTDVIKMALISSAATMPAKTAANPLYSDVSASQVGTAQTLAGTSLTLGVINCTSPVAFGSPAGGSTVKWVIIYHNTTGRLIAVYDGSKTITAAVTAGTGATSITVDPLPAALASGASAAFSGGVTATLTAGASAGARSIAVSALGGAGVAQNETCSMPYSSGGLPFTTSGGPVNFNVDATNKLFKV